MNGHTLTGFLLVVPSFLISQPSSGSDTTKTYFGKEVIVTATRGSGEVLEIPAAVGVINLKDLPSGRNIGINEALSFIPGILAQTRSGGEDIRLTVRGFGARGSGDRSNAATIRGIKILLDGIPETEPDGRTPLDLIDLNATEKIEIVRSNASTLFGNASGGVINFQSGSATLGTFVETNNVVGTFGFQKNNVSAAAEFGNNNVFLSASDARFEGWRQNSKNRIIQMNAVLNSELTDAANLRVLASAASNEFSIPGALTQQQFDSDPTQSNPIYLARRERRENRTGRLAFDLFAALSEHHSIDALAYITPKIQARSERGQYRDFNRYHLGGGLVYTLSGHQDSFLKRFMFGGDEAYQDGTILFYNLVNGNRGDSLRTNKREGAETFGLFTQTELRLLDNFMVTLGLRYDRQRYIAEDYAAGAKKTNVPETLTLYQWTPKMALLYRLTPNHSAYVNIGGGLEAPAFNEVDPPPAQPNAKLNPFLEPMTSTSYEAGIKGAFPTDQWSFINGFVYSVAFYRIDIKNEIVPWNGGAYFFSAGESRRLGAEFSGQVYFPWGISFTSAFTYLDAKYDTYTNDLGNFGGNTVPGIPKTVFSAQLKYTSAVGLSAALGIDNVGSYFADDANSLSLPASTVLNVSASYVFHTLGIDFSVSGGINNVADLKYSSSAFINPVNGAYLEPGLPRNFFGGMSARLSL